MKAKEMSEKIGMKVIKNRGKYKIKRIFFYTGGWNVEKEKVRVSEKLREAGINVVEIESHEHWNTWPRESYWETIFTI